MKKNFEILVNRIADKGIRAEETTVWKNGKEYSAFVFGDGNVRPNITVEKLQQMIEDYGFEKTVEFIIESVQNAPNGDCIVDKANDINYLCDNAILCVQRASDESILKRSVCDDLEAYIRVEISRNGDGFASAKVTSAMESIYTAEEINRLWESAENNLIDKLQAFDLGTLFDGSVSGMIVISTTDNQFGAGFIAVPDVLKRIAEKYELGKKVCILPSSIHEIIMTQDTGADNNELTDMITDINASVVDETEVLSNHAYHFEF